MELRIPINEKAVFALLIVVAMVSAVGITLAQTPNPGHPWSQIDCSGCITSADIGDGQVASADLAGNAVTSAKIADGQVASADVNFNYAGSSSKGGSATSAASVPWSGVTGMPAEIANDDDYTTCSWSGWKEAYPDLNCGTGWCIGWATVLEFECVGSKITNSRTTTVCVSCDAGGT